MLGLGFAALAVGSMLAGWWWVAAAGVQLRLLCNMLDGLIAVEHGKGDKLGGFFNEVPDRLEDIALLLAAGVAASGAIAGADWLTGERLGWAAAVLALGTAYLRQVGGAMGLVQDFSGPLAKPQRMFVLTVTSLVAGFCADAGTVVRLGLVVIVVGTAVTLVRRTVRLMSALQRR